MARRKIIGPQPRAPYTRGALVVYWSDKWQRYVVRSWPKGNGGDTPKRKASRETFKQVTAIIKRAADLDVEASYRCAKSTQFLPRDLLAKAAYGTLMQFRDKSGTVWTGVRVLQSDIQALLASLGNNNGMILLNEDGEWVCLLPGDAGDVLTMDGTTGRAKWLPPSGGGGGSAGAYSLVCPITGNAGDAYASLGYYATMPVDMKLLGVGGTFRPTSGRTYDLSYAAYDPSSGQLTQDAQVLGTFAPSTSASPQGVGYLASSPPTIAAGSSVAVFLTRTDGSNTSTPDCYYYTGSNGIIGFGLNVPVTQGLKLASTSPANGDSPTAASALWTANLLLEPA